MANKTLKLLIKGNADIVDAALSRADGGAKLDEGVKELVAGQFPGVRIETSQDASHGFGALRAELESGNSRLIDDKPDIVLLSIGQDIMDLGTDGTDTETAVHTIEADLVAAIDLIKEKVGAHVLIANASTLDPDLEVYNYHEQLAEPPSLSAHRLDLMLVGVSHNEGISIIDVDRKIAELGGAKGVIAALDYSQDGCEVLAKEIVRVIEDYGFFDDRPLLAQVGARGRNT